MSSDSFPFFYIDFFEIFKSTILTLVLKTNQKPTDFIEKHFQGFFVSHKGQQFTKNYVKEYKNECF